MFSSAYGMSYSTFDYGNLLLSREKIALGESLTVSVEVTNTSDRDGSEVVQLYLHQRWGSDTRPIRELKGFQKVFIPAGEKRTITFCIGPEEMTYYSTAKQSYVQDPAVFDLWVGSDSTADLQGVFEVTA